jgi:hypothetical protein
MPNKGPNSRPDKGFSKELQTKSQMPAKGKKEFSWNKPVVPVTKSVSMATPHRLENNRAVKKQPGEFAKQTIDHRNTFNKKG